MASMLAIVKGFGKGGGSLFCGGRGLLTNAHDFPPVDRSTREPLTQSV
jgi:hypothetical protein